MSGVILYADERRPTGRWALDLFAGLDVVHIPTSGGLPRAIRGRACYDDPSELRALAWELRAERAAAEFDVVVGQFGYLSIIGRHTNFPLAGRLLDWHEGERYAGLTQLNLERMARRIPSIWA